MKWLDFCGGMVGNLLIPHKSKDLVENEHREHPKPVPKNHRIWPDDSTKMMRKYEQNTRPDDERDDDHGTSVNEEIQQKAGPKRGTQIRIFLAESVACVQIQGL